MKYAFFILTLLLPHYLLPNCEEKIVDSAGYAYYLTKDSCCDRIIKKQIKDNHNTLIFSEECKYDCYDNLIETQDLFYRKEKWCKQTIHFNYNENNQIISLVKNYGSSNERKIGYEYYENGNLAVKTNPNGVKVFYNYDNLGNLYVLSSDETINYTLYYNENGFITKVEDHINNNIIYREVDEHGNITKELFPNGHEIEVIYNDNDNPIVIRGNTIGEIHYEYENTKLRKVIRISPSENISYSHQYSYDENGNLQNETLIGNLGQIHYQSNINTLSVTITSPYSIENCCYSELGNLISHKIDNTEVLYKYDNFSRICNWDTYDMMNNPINSLVNDLNELQQYNDIRCEYDQNGNLIAKYDNENNIFTYDALGRLIEAKTNTLKINFTYDFFGRRLSKTTFQNGTVKKESFLYFNNNEIAIVENNQLKQLRIPGNSFHKDIVKAIAIEINKSIFSPIHDVQGNIIKLIDIETSQVHDFGYIDPFGNNLSNISINNWCPWFFASKHYDYELDLVYFGHRYYSPSLKRWITCDTFSPFTNNNLYTYVLNNPFRYADPDGKFAILIPLVGLGAKTLIEAIAISIGIWGIVETGKIINQENSNKKEKEPPYDGRDLGDDPSKCPGEGFEWKGGEKGQWHNKDKKHSLRPDLNHPGDVKPHWDYKGPEGKARLNIDGTWEMKE